MCLNTVQEGADLSVYEGTEVFKVFKVLKVLKDSSLKGQFANAPLTRDRGRWLDSETFSKARILRTGDYGSATDYPAGWHSFVNEEDAKNWCFSTIGEVVVKVRVKRILALGTQETMMGHQAPALVSRYMLIPEAEMAHEG